jgi:hypothetical protein
MFHQGRILYTSLYSLIMTIICLDRCQWSLMSLIIGNKSAKIIHIDSLPYLKKNQNDHKELRFRS